MFNLSKFVCWYGWINNLEGDKPRKWRADKIIGTNMLVGDPSFNAWSIISLIFRIPLENKIILHNFIFLALTLYASISIYILINFANPKINKISASILASLIFISCLRFEVNYVFSWILVFPTVAFTSLILFKFFETGKINYIFLLFLNFFVGFNLGSIFAIISAFLDCGNPCEVIQYIETSCFTPFS